MRFKPRDFGILSTKEVIFMRKSTKRILSVFFALLLLPVTAFATDTSEDTSDPVYVLDYFEGSALDVSQYEGKALFLNFFTEWCPYCMAEMPDIKEIYDLYDPDSLEIILIHPWDGEDASNTASVVETYGLEGVTTIEDEDFTLTGIVGVPGYPTTVIIDPEGYLYYAVASKLDYDTLTSVFDAMGIPRRDETADETADSADADETATPAPETSDEAAQATPQP